MNLTKPPLKYLKQMYSSFDRKYKKNIKRLIIVHPTSWMKTVWMFLKPFISAKFGQKVTYINHLRKMFLEKRSWRWSSCLHCPMSNSDHMIIGKTRPTLFEIQNGLRSRNRKSELKEWCYINQLSIPIEVKNFDNKK